MDIKILENQNKDFFANFQSLREKKIVIFGAGQRGGTLLSLFRNVEIEASYFCDNNPEKWGKELNQVPILSFLDLLQVENKESILVFISLNTFDSLYPEIELQLKEGNFSSVLSPQEVERIWFVLSCYQEVKEEENISPTQIEAKLDQCRSWFTEKRSLQIFDARTQYRFCEEVSEEDCSTLLWEGASPLCREFLQASTLEKFLFTLPNTAIESVSNLIFVGVTKEAEGNYEILISSPYFIEKNIHKKNLYFCSCLEEEIGTSFCGHPVLSKEEVVSSYLGEDNFFLFLETSRESDWFRYSLLSLGVEYDYFSYISSFGDKDNQYFDQEILSLGQDEIFVDAGGENGFSTLRFAAFTENKYKHSYLFDPNEESLQIAKDRLESAQISNYTIHPYGLWNQKDTLKFGGFAGNFSVLFGERENSLQIEVLPLDDFLEGKPVTFIKMDIEGSELQALQGAKETILAHKPKLAICVYHKSSDFLTIPQYIKSLVPEYRFYLRQYSTKWNETVLFAVL